MSDDSHGIDQIGTNYVKLLAYIQKAGIEEIHFVDAAGSRSDIRFPDAGFSSITTSKLADLSFWGDKQQ